MKEFPRLKLLRLALGYKQKDIAQRMGISTKLVSAWECGRLKPSSEQKEEIARILGVDLTGV